MKPTKITYGIVLLIFIMVLHSCAVEHYIPEDERLYTGASVVLETDSTIKNQENLKVVLAEALRPEPNKKFLGMYPGLHYYYKVQQDSTPGFFNKWMNKQIGEPPVYQSDVQAFEVEEILVNRLENRGFFYSRAGSDFIEEENKKRAAAVYTVKVPTPYTMENYQLDSISSPLYESIQQSVAGTKLQKGMRFDLSNLKLERERIDSDLKKKGYYNFNPGFLIFEADTNQYNNKKFDLFLTLKKDVPEQSKIPYRIAKLNVYADYNIQDSTKTDPIRFNDKNYIDEEGFFKQKYLDPFITLEEGQYYDPETSKNTARRLSGIGAYKFVNIQYTEIPSEATDSLGQLEANIFLSPLNKRAVRAELQAVTKSNNFAGPGLALTYTNRNLFRGGEVLNIIGNVGYEVQAGGGGGSTGKSSIELGLKGELIFPRVISPIKVNTDFFKYSIPKTKTSLGVDYLSRSELYTLLSGTAQFGYIWRANRYVTHEIIPVSVNYTKLSNTTEAFETILTENPFLRRSFDQQFISGLNYSFTYNGMIDTQKTHQFFLNATLDVAGNSISLFGKEETPGAPKTFLGLEYAQFAKADMDIRYHFNFGKEQKIATRLFAGYGYAYGNSEVVPFVKQYYSGGPYSVRAFRIRSLGPGTVSNEFDDQGTVFDRTGNIRLEGNIEYRFPLFGFVKGALFADAGNIWNSKETEIYEGASTFSSSFISELGMGAGFGVRVDIQGFVIRFDLAAPFHDPGEPEGERFKFKADEPVLNFAIGYPF